MNKLLSKSSLGAVAFLALALLRMSIAYAQPHERYHTNHWVFDDRFHHDHYYPRVGYTVHALPPGYVVVKYQGGPFYYHAGVWYRASGPGFVVITPPIGIVVAALPPAYATIYAAGVPYYYANDVYYQQVPGGYAVVNQPPNYVQAPQAPMAQAPQAAPPQASAPQAPAPGTWYYCDSAKAYYPYVSECKEGWRPVPAAPPSTH
jgi:hypothetical protein